MKTSPQSCLPIVFIRGLNSHADDLQHLGPLTFGPIAQPLTLAFQARGLALVALRDLNMGSLEDHIRAADRSLRSTELWAGGRSFHLLGHSLGGLIGRGLLRDPEIRSRVVSLGTVGSPHNGAPIAEVAIRAVSEKPLITRFLQAVQYDLAERVAHFASFTPQAVAEFNVQTPNHREIYYFSAACATPFEHLALPYLALQLQLPAEHRQQATDGMIPLASQRFGRELGFYQLDHLMQLGFCFDPRPSVRARFRREWDRLLTDLTQFYYNHDSELVD